MPRSPATIVRARVLAAGPPTANLRLREADGPWASGTVGAVAPDALLPAAELQDAVEPEREAEADGWERAWFPFEDCDDPLEDLLKSDACVGC